LTLGFGNARPDPPGTEPAGWQPLRDRPTHPAASSRPRRTALAVAALVAALALVGALARTLGSGSGARPGSLASRAPAHGAATGSSAPSPASDRPGSPARLSDTSSNLLTPAGVRRTVAVIRRLIAGTKVFELDIYSDSASAQAPTASDPALYDDIEYRDGVATRSPGGTATSEQTVDLRGFNWDVLPALLKKARQTLNVPHPTFRYIIIGPDLFDGTPSIRVYLSDAYGAGYLSASPDGTVRRTYPRGS
jgi:hypothetical protein